MTHKRVLLTRPEYTRAPITRAHHVASKNKSGMGRDIDPPIRGLSPHHSQGPQVNNKLEVGELTRLADQLSPADRQQLLDHLALKQSNEAGDPREVEMWCGAIYEALQDTLGASAGAMGGPMLVRRVVGSPSVWRPVDSFMQSSGLADLQVRERQLVYGMLADLLVKYAAQVAGHVGVPLSVKFVGNNAINLAGVFEQSFPGYLAAGLAPTIARGLG